MSAITPFMPNNNTEYAIAAGAGAAGAGTMVKIVGPSTTRRQLSKAFDAWYKTAKKNALDIHDRQLQGVTVFGEGELQKVRALKVNTLITAGANPSKLRVGSSILIGAVIGAGLIAGAVNAAQAIGD